MRDGEPLAGAVTDGVVRAHCLLSSWPMKQIVMLALSAIAACDGKTSSPTTPEPVHVVLFTHVEDAMPTGRVGTTENRASYDDLRGRLIDLATHAREIDLPWVLQPDWKLLEAALAYDDGLFLELDGLGATIDPHSHENGGYNYTDVAYLLEQLGVGGSTVIGGHIWDPSLPQFQEWDRFRGEVTGMKYPQATWRGDILIGAGTPNHVNDPLVSGVWRPRDRDHYFEDDPAGNIYSIGAWHDEVDGVRELVELSASGALPDAFLTAAWNISPSMLMGPGGVASVAETVLAPIAAMRDEGTVVVSNFTSLVDTWRTERDGTAYLYQP